MKPIVTVIACSAVALALGGTALAAHARQQFSVVAASYTSKKVGSGEIFKEHLFVAGKRVGHDVVSCAPQGKKMLCDGTMYLPKGQIRIRVLAGGGPNTSGAILGGAGAYAGARGTVTLRGIPHDRDRITFTIA